MAVFIKLGLNLRISGKLNWKSLNLLLISILIVLFGFNSVEAFNRGYSTLSSGEKIGILMNEVNPSIGAEALHNEGINGTDVNVCILSSGVDLNNSYINVTEAKDFTNGDWCIDTYHVYDFSKSEALEYDFYLNVSNVSLDWLEVGLGWDGNELYNITVYYNDSNEAGNTSDKMSNYVNGPLINHTIAVNVSNNGHFPGILKIHLIRNSTNPESAPVIFWGSNVTNISTYLNSTNFCNSYSGDPVKSGLERSFYNINSPFDDYGEGTYLAGVIKSNHTTYKGIAPGVKIYSGKILTSSRGVNSSEVVNAINWCLSKNTSIILLALRASYNNCNNAITQAIENATNLGALVVVPAGDDGYNSSNDKSVYQSIAFPGCSKSAFTVGYTYKTNDLILNSSKGPANFTNVTKPDIVAIGYNVTSIYFNDNFTKIDSSSSASAIVAGAAALLKNKYTNMSGIQLKAALMTLADKTKLKSIEEDYNISNKYGAGNLILDGYNNLSVNLFNLTIGNNRFFINATSTSDIKAILYWNEGYSEHTRANVTLKDLSGNVIDDTGNPNDTAHQVVGKNKAPGFYILDIKVDKNVSAVLSTWPYEAYMSPEVYLISPNNIYETNNSNINFTYQVKDALYNLSKCALYTNVTGSFSESGSNLSAIVNYKYDNITINNLTLNVNDDGVFVWNIYCTNENGKTGFNLTNRTFIRDTSPPIFVIYSPINNTNTSNNTILLNWSVSDLTFNKTEYYLNGTKVGESQLASSQVSIPVNPGMNQNLTIYFKDKFGYTNSTTIYFNVDKMAPNLTLLSPLNNETINENSVWINYTASDNIGVKRVYYYNSLGSGNLSGNQSVPLEYPGTYNLTVCAEDDFSNLNCTSVKFYVNFPMNMTNWTNKVSSSLNYNLSISTNGSDQSQNETFNVNQSINLTIYNNTDWNLTIMNFNGLGANWGKFLSITNDDLNVSNAIIYMGSKVVKMVFVRNVTNFLNSNYFGLVRFKGNSTTESFNGIFYCQGEIINNTSCTKINSCNGGYNGNACFNETTNYTDVFVPHFSAIVLSNDSIAPSIIVNSPLNQSYNDDTIFLIANLTTSADTIYCNYSLSGNTIQNRDKSTSGSSTYSWDIGPLLNGVYNISFYCKDGYNNSNSTYVIFTYNDTLIPTIDSKNENVDSTSATISWSTNEYTNSTILYGTSSSSLSKNVSKSDFEKNHILSISDLKSGTKYYYNITSCDINGHCVTNGTFDFTTEGNTTSNTDKNESDNKNPSGNTQNTDVTEISHVWLNIPAGQKTTMSISSEKIALTKVTFTFLQDIKSVMLNVKSLGTDEPSGISKTPPNKVYQFMEVSLSVSNSLLSSANFEFRIPKTWFTSENTDPNSVYLYRYYDGTWQSFNTDMIDNSGNYYTYQTKVPGFSYFAIASKIKESAKISTNNTTNDNLIIVTNNSEQQNNSLMVNQSTNATSKSFIKSLVDFSKDRRYIFVGLAGLIVISISTFFIIKYLKVRKNKYELSFKEAFSFEPIIESKGKKKNKMEEPPVFKLE